MKGTEVPKGDAYEPGVQVKKTLKPGVETDPEEIIKNVL